MTQKATTQDSQGEWTPERIKSLRARLGLTHAELAARCGVTLTAAQRWVLPETSAGRTRPPGPVRLILDQLDAEARRHNPMGISLIDPGKRGPRPG